MSASSGASRGSETGSNKPKSSGFSFSRLLPGKRRSKSRLSLESDASRSDSGPNGVQLSPPHSSSNLASSSSPQPPAPGFLHTRRKNSGSLGSPMVDDRGEGSAQTFSSLEGLCRSRIPPISNGEHGSNGFTDGEEIGMGRRMTEREELIECPVCFVEKSKDNFMEISTCHHRCCTKCLRVYFKIEIMESRPSIACPECSELYHPNDIRTIVQDVALMHKYEDFMLRRVLAMDSDTRWCPAPDCGYAVIATGCAGCPKLQCERPGCGTFFCYHCKQHWHPNQTCDAARAERLPGAVRSDSLTYSQESSGTGGAQGGKDVIKSCPRCGALIVKMDDLSCNHMICAVCGANFCWLCLKEMSDLHYLSLSGCTFWGRRPWSRKKKILCQLGTLVGAPVGIPLVAGLAVPAIIIGIPIWIGQKIHFRYQQSSKHKRNLAIVSGVAASLLASPVIAGLFVGLGVPALLVYVYGVVPVSLCRSQGCGVTTNTSGVRFEFDEQGEGHPQGPYSSAGDTQSIETAPNVANPSIAPSIGDASLGMTNSLSASGSHIERVGVLRDDSDRDSASHRAMAGNSINGSLCSATYSNQHHKLEVQADILELAVHCEKSSVGGESYSMSLNDDASTRALAGSIVSPKDKDGISLCSRHFDSSSGATCLEDQRTETDIEPSLSAHSLRQQTAQQRASSPSEDSCSVLLHHGGSHRGKKLTRFMDQVAEIGAGGEEGSDCCGEGAGDLSPSSQGTVNMAHCAVGGNDIVRRARSPSQEVAVCAVESVEGKKRSKSATRANSLDANPACYKNPAPPKPSSSLPKHGNPKQSKPSTSLLESDQQSVGLCSCSGPGCSGVRVKADSTSMLVDSSCEWRPSELGSGRRKSDSTSSCCQDPRLLPSSQCCGASSERTLSVVSGGAGAGLRGRGGGLMLQRCGRGGAHLSQPSNLWDISELQAGMLPRLQHTTRCSDMLAVVDAVDGGGARGGASCDSVFLQGGAGHHHYHDPHHKQRNQQGKWSASSSCSHLVSASSAGSFSSTDDQLEVFGCNTSCHPCPGEMFDTLIENDICEREQVSQPVSSSFLSLPGGSSPRSVQSPLHASENKAEEPVRPKQVSRKVRQHKSPSMLRSAKSWDEAASLEAVSLLEPSVSVVSDGGVPAITTAVGPLASLPSYLPDIEMPSSRDHKPPTSSSAVINCCKLASRVAVVSNGADEDDYRAGQTAEKGVTNTDPAVVSLLPLTEDIKTGAREGSSNDLTTSSF